MSMLHRVEKELAGRKLVLEVGEVAKQANGATLLVRGDGSWSQRSSGSAKDRFRAWR
jgi:polyribonucleotide nucleotidyltransferase